MSPVKAKICSKSDQNRVGDTTCKTVEKRTVPEQAGRRSADPPPQADVMADPPPPHTPLGGEPKREPCACASGKKQFLTKRDL